MAARFPKQFPANEGWMRMVVTLKSAKPLEEERLKFAVTMGMPGLYEFGYIRQRGRMVTVYLREKPRQCAGCGCTDADCLGCIQKTGKPCHWVEHNLCSACA